MLKVLIYALPLILAVYALVDCIQTPAAEVRGLPKIVWIAVIVVIMFFGPLAWLMLGRERGSVRSLLGPPPSAGSTRPTVRRTLGPDDDPDFLRNLGPGKPATPSGPRRPPSGEEDALLEEWERDLRRDDPADTQRDGPEDEGPESPGDGAPRV